MRRVWLRIGLLLTTAAMAGAQQYPFVLTPESPHGIFTLMQDSHSAIWLGTIDDALRFDGGHFYSLRSYGFPRETPNSFAEDSEGGIWIATQGTDAYGGTGRGGLYRYRAGKIAKVLAGDVMTIAALAPGVMVASVGTEANGKPSYGDLYLFRGLTPDSSGTKWSAASLLSKQADHLTLDHQGDVLFPCPGGWCEVSREQLLDWHGPRSVDVQRHAGSPMLERVLRDREGCMWFRAEAFASYQCAGDREPKVVPASVAQYDSSAHLEEMADGSILTLVALAVQRPGSIHAAASSNGVPEPIDTAMAAKDGTIWVGAESGLYRFPYPFRLSYWGKESGAGSPFAILRNGENMFASRNGLLKLNGTGGYWGAVAGTQGLSGTLATGPHGTMFSATRDLLVQYSPEGKVVARQPIANDLSAGTFLAAGRSGDLWLGRKGVEHVTARGGGFNLQPESQTIGQILDLRYDSARDTLWACDGNEVAFREDGEWNRITQKDGLLDFPCESLAIEPNGDVWVGYRVNAYSWIREPLSGHPVVRNYTQWLNDVVQNSGAHFLAFDQRGRLWLGANVLRVATAEGAKAGQWITLNEQDGMQPPWVDEHPFWSDVDGSVWMGTSDSIAHFSPPDDFLTHFPAPSVFIAGFSIGQSGAVLADAMGEIPRNADVTAHIGSLQFDRRSALHIRYRLLPEEARWTDASNLNLHLGRLSWGQHTLQVQAELATGPWSAIDEQSIHVLWPLWLSWPVLLGVTLATGTTAASGWRWRKKRRARAEKIFPELAEWRLAALSPELQKLDGKLLDARFEIGHVLARGGFATVVKGRDLKEGGRPCAVKIFRQELIDKDWMARRFRQEVLALATIHHPNVVQIYGHGTTPTGSPYLVMEFVDGKTLRQALEDTRLTPQQTALYLRQMGAALDAIHALGICHRDLKPENLMIRSASPPGAELVLIDFSIAIVKDPDETLHGLSRAAGTLYYMAPEQAIGFANSSTDIYSLAKIVMEMLTGERLSALLPDASMDLPARVREFLGGLPVRLNTPAIELLSSALEFDPSRRPKAAGEFATRIADDLEHSPWNG
jgi:tRNA A-37 threonylcarbamoyl transferase component Bud32